MGISAGIGDVIGGLLGSGAADVAATTAAGDLAVAGDVAAGAGIAGAGAEAAATGAIGSAASGIGMAAGTSMGAVSGMSQLGTVSQGLGLANSALSLGSGLTGLAMAGSGGAQQAQYASQANALGPYAAGYAQQLQQLEANPSSVQNLPQYQAGLQAVQRSGAAQGYAGSTNMMSALAQYGGQAYQQQFSNLLSLVNSGSGQAATAANATGQANVANANLVSQSLGSLGYGATTLNNTLNQPQLPSQNVPVVAPLPVG